MKVKPPGYPSVEFSDACLLQYLERPDTPYCTQEVALEGNYLFL